jgi:hypothetical protein
MGGACSTHGVMRNVYKIFVGKPEGKRPLRKSRCRCEDNIKMDICDTVLDDMDWMHPVQGRDKTGS